MSCNSLMFCLIMMTCSVCLAQEVKFPSYHGKVQLGYIGVNDSPTDHFSTELMPGLSRGTGNQGCGYYDVGIIYDNGHTLYLGCIYGALDSKDRVVVKAEKRVSRCFYHAYPSGKPANLTCR